eukprot:scaffold310_cov19-Tisochrysis_lutea.AAC.2
MDCPMLCTLLSVALLSSTSPFCLVPAANSHHVDHDQPSLNCCVLTVRALLIVGVMAAHAFGEGSGVGVSFSGRRGHAQSKANFTLNRKDMGTHYVAQAWVRHSVSTGDMRHAKIDPEDVTLYTNVCACLSLQTKAQTQVTMAIGRYSALNMRHIIRLNIIGTGPCMQLYALLAEHAGHHCHQVAHNVMAHCAMYDRVMGTLATIATELHNVIAQWHAGHHRHWAAQCSGRHGSGNGDDGQRRHCQARPVLVTPVLHAP